jgi:hypothetical protein
LPTKSVAPNIEQSLSLTNYVHDYGEFFLNDDISLQYLNERVLEEEIFREVQTSFSAW